MIRRYVRKLSILKDTAEASMSMLQATESPLLHDGSQNTLSTASPSFRNSTNTGVVLSGPQGSGQFLAVVQSTGAARTLQLPSTVTQSYNCYGICQNKPAIGEAVDVGIFGISKMVAGSTTILAGTELGMSATAAGVVIPWVAGGGKRLGVSLENVGTIGQVFTGSIYGFGQGGGST
jgi:hypothetical protein